MEASDKGLIEVSAYVCLLRARIQSQTMAKVLDGSLVQPILAFDVSEAASTTPRGKCKDAKGVVAEALAHLTTESGCIRKRSDYKYCAMLMLA